MHPLKHALKEKLPAELLSSLKTAYDVVGSIAILEIDDELREYEKIIGETLLQIDKKIKTVLRKDGPHQEPYRTQNMVFLAGINTREALYTENGTQMLLNVETVYFSPRLAAERLRIAHQVKKNETVLSLFSGYGPYPCVIGKIASPKLIVGIELNPQGQFYAQLNVKRNKLSNVELYEGDVHTVIPTLKIREYDRIIMSLPKHAYEFLDDALSVSKIGTVIHYYDLVHEDEFDIAKRRIADACRKNNVKYKLLGIHTSGNQGVRLYRICIDFQII